MNQDPGSRLFSRFPHTTNAAYLVFVSTTDGEGSGTSLQKTRSEILGNRPCASVEIGMSVGISRERLKGPKRLVFLYAGQAIFEARLFMNIYRHTVTQIPTYHYYCSYSLPRSENPFS
jgi:hypothetical protein